MNIEFAGWQFLEPRRKYDTCYVDAIKTAQPESGRDVTTFIMALYSEALLPCSHPFLNEEVARIKGYALVCEFAAEQAWNDCKIRETKVKEKV